jgi:hypothetical protein
MKRQNEPIAVDPLVSYDPEIQDLLADGAQPPPIRWREESGA